MNYEEALAYVKENGITEFMIDRSKFQEGNQSKDTLSIYL
jgi:hypothetical protein